MRETGVVNLRGIEFTRVLNRYMKMSLISEGTLYVANDWVITGQDGIKTCEPPTALNIEPFQADMCGNLAFWPQQDVVSALSETNQGV